jgi:membrane associated rhomboid family serine protease
MVYRGGTPVTNGLIIANVVTLLTAFFVPSLHQWYSDFITFSTADVLQKPWTLVSYVLFTPSLLGVLLGGLMLWQFGGSLERSWGSATYTRVLAALSVLTALSLLLGAFVVTSVSHGAPHSVELAGLLMPVAALTVAFCMIRPNEIINLMLVLPIPAKYIALITVAFCWYDFGPILGFFACGGCLAAWLYVRGRAGHTSFGGFSTPRVTRGPDLEIKNFDRPRRPNVYIDGSPPPPKPYDLARILKERQERKRLEKLWNESRIPPAEDWPDEDRR